MVFYGLRKFARELGLEVQSGVVCGIYKTDRCIVNVFTKENKIRREK